MPPLELLPSSPRAEEEEAEGTPAIAAAGAAATDGELAFCSDSRDVLLVRRVLPFGSSRAGVDSEFASSCSARETSSRDFDRFND